MKRLILGIIVLLLTSSNLNAGQFGLKMGMTINEIDKNAKFLFNGYYMVKVPKPHSFFDEYMVGVCKTKGLFFINALKKNISTSAYGTQIKSDYDELEKKIIKTYGKNKRFDYLNSGSIWEEEKYWMMGLLKKERRLRSSWTKSTGLKDKDNLKQIIMAVMPRNTERGDIALQYIYQNADSCQKELSKQDDDSL